MKNKVIISMFLVLLGTLFTHAQEEQIQKEIEKLKTLKTEITQQEKQALKEEVEAINAKLEAKLITKKEADELKGEAAKKRALNIENRIAIIENRIALIERNKGKVLEVDTLNYLRAIEIGFGNEDGDNGNLFGIRINNNPLRSETKYDRRTYSDFVMAIGFNNAIIEGESFVDTPYKIAGSRFFEMGWQWRTRVFKNSNWLRFNYGFSFQFNGLKPEKNQYFVMNENQTELQEFDVELDKSKLRMDNLVFPIHFEVGPSKTYKTEEKIRYSLQDQFRIGFGGYGGFNIGTRQKLKYQMDGDKIKDKLKRDYNTSNLIYGLSAYAGVDGMLLYVKYDLNPIFKDAVITQRNISVGLRFDL